MDRISINRAVSLVWKHRKGSLFAVFVVSFVISGLDLGKIPFGGLMVLGVYILMAIGIANNVECGCGALVNPHKDNFCPSCAREVPEALQRRKPRK